MKPSAPENERTATAPRRRRRKFSAETCLYVSLIAGLSGAIGGAAGFWALDLNMLGAAMCAPVPSIMMWLVLVHFLRSLSWPRTACIGLCAGLIWPVLQSPLLLLFLPISVLLGTCYISIPLQVITAFSIRSVLLADPQELVDYPACQECGYNLTGNTSRVCPECGTSLDRDRAGP